MQRRPDSPGTAGALSLSNVEKTREFIEAYNRRDFETAIRWFDPRVRWVLPEQQGFDSCVGPDQIILWWEELDDIYDDHILDHYESPYHKGHLEHPTCAHCERNPLCGDVVRLVYLRDGRDHVTAAVLEGSQE